MFLYFFFFNDTATTEIYTLSLHDALPICPWPLYSVASARQTEAGRASDMDRDEALRLLRSGRGKCVVADPTHPTCLRQDRKSTRLNSSHANISYAVFCLKKKKKKRPIHHK